MGWGRAAPKRRERGQSRTAAGEGATASVSALAALANRIGLTTSWRISSKLSRGRRWATLSRLPVKKESRQRTWSPRSTRASQRWDPTNPVEVVREHEVHTMSGDDVDTTGDAASVERAVRRSPRQRRPFPPVAVGGGHIARRLLPSPARVSCPCGVGRVREVQPSSRSEPVGWRGRSGGPYKVGMVAHREDGRDREPRRDFLMKPCAISCR